MNNLRRIDLNLLLTLDVLLAEHNVTRAAQRLNFSQPSISVHLAKLREIFADPLLLPGPRGMRPTARAEELRGPLRDALAALEQVVAPTSPFNPAAAEHTWQLAVSDYGELTVVQPALGRLLLTAPNTRMALLALAPARMAKQLEQGEIDLALHTAHDSPANLRHRVLFKERYVLACRADHPRLKRRPSLAQFCKLDHVLVSPAGSGFVGVTDEALAQVGLSRRVVLSVPRFQSVLAVLTSTDLVSMLPERLVQGNPALRVYEPPVAVPGFELAMLWHERSHRDPAHQWLREQLVR
ncbi:MAG: LysR family transcriptional regulator [Pseudomonas sp.]